MSQPSPTGPRDGPAWLRRDAERISGALPPLMAQAERLAASVVPGVHGRKRAGMGETFWQYRQALPGDPATAIDWRRSARSDGPLYIREMEWEAAQTVWLWADDSASMDWRSDAAPRTKAERARLLALALGVLLIRGGERAALLGTGAERPATGEPQLLRMALELARAPEGPRPDTGAPPRAAMAQGGKAAFLSDFMGPHDAVFPALIHAAERGVSGCFLQILDPAEEDFPYDGRLVMQSPGGAVEVETHRARGLRDAYLERLAQRRADLGDFARRCGWQVAAHRTDESPRKALLWLYAGLGRA